jgi:CheY-like chemotaxis protein
MHSLYEEKKESDRPEDFPVTAFLPVPFRKSHLRALVERPASAVPVQTVQTPTPMSVPPTAMRILLVEDNLINQHVAVAVLKKLGFTADLAINGEEAVMAATATSYDLVLMDCQMPVLDGYKASRRIRELEGEARRTPIVAMTANAMEGDRERCLEAGMDDYIPKPVTLDGLRGILQQWLPLAFSQS